MIGTEGNPLILFLDFNSFLGEIQSLLRITLPLDIAYRNDFQKYLQSLVINYQVSLYSFVWPTME